MRLTNPQAVALALETGLGGVRSFEGFRPDMRLRMSGVCGLASIAIGEHIPGRRFTLSRPNMSVNPEYTHLYPVTPEGIVIDTSYTHLLWYAGLTPGYIAHGGKDTYPKEKIAVFPVGKSQRVVRQLTRHARIAIDTYVAPDDPRYNSHLEFGGMTNGQIAADLSKVWDPANGEDWQPDDHMLELGRAIATLIDPADLQLID